MLTNHQQQVLEQSVQILDHSERLLIKGSAGVGKTYLADTLIDAMIRVKRIRWQKILCTAPTNKAVAVLKSKVRERDNLDFVTVHSAMKLKRQIDYKSGDISFKPWFSERYPPLKNVALMVIDEASMLNTEVLSYVETYAKENGTTVIFLGDEKQLNPINEKNSIVFHSNYPEVELTEIVRQGEGNPIIALSRNMSTISKRIADVTNDNKGFTYTANRDRIIESLAKVNGGDNLKYLAWTNADVDSMNKQVREKIYGIPAKIELGETLIFNAPYGDDYFTNEEIEVEELTVLTQHMEIEVLETKVGYKIETPTIPIDLKMYRINRSIRVVHEDSEKEFKQLVMRMKSNCKAGLYKWKEYFKFVESFADLKYSHAITVHKSQGSTYQKTIVNIGNLSNNRNKIEKARLFYTAITRASDLLILYNVK